MSRANDETYAPVIVKSPESRPSEPKIFAPLPCSFICSAKSWPFAATCHGRKTTVVSSGTFVTSDEKSVTFWFTDSRCTETWFALRIARRGRSEARRVSLLIVDDDDLLRVQLVDHEQGVRAALSRIASDDARERRVLALRQR